MTACVPARVHSGTRRGAMDILRRRATRVPASCGGRLVLAALPEIAQRKPASAVRRAGAGAAA